VIALPYGFRYQGKIYRSLTGIALELLSRRIPGRWARANREMNPGAVQSFEIHINILDHDIVGSGKSLPPPINVTPRLPYSAHPYSAHRLIQCLAQGRRFCFSQSATGHSRILATSLSCVLVSKSLLSWRSCN